MPKLGNNIFISKIYKLQQLFLPRSFLIQVHRKNYREIRCTKLAKVGFEPSAPSYTGPSPLPTALLRSLKRSYHSSGLEEISLHNPSDRLLVFVVQAHSSIYME